ncbi:MAG TPA: glycosyltransferase [Gemmatimonadales bacterium]|nr:glycosyltransferase [Gemmatimonadales bacterium]
MSSTEIAIGIATWRRPEGLARLLAGLGNLVFVKVPRPKLTVIVADNDPAGSASSVCRAGIPGGNARLGYVVEPRPGLAPVRNRLLAHVPAGAAALALVDDDEVPAPSWLDELLDLWRRTGAGIVAGRVEPHFPEPVPAWVGRGRFFHSRPAPSGAPTRRGGTCNCLIDARIFRELGLRFDEAYAESGGEDTHFFWRARAAGERVVWCDEAVVTEWVPRERATVGWLARREYREGGTVALVERELAPPAPVLSRAGRVLRGGGRIAQGVARLAVSPPLGATLTASAVEGVKLAARGAGMIAGSFGIRYREYARRGAR